MTQSLVTLLTGFTEEKDEDTYNDALELVARKIDSGTKQGMSTDMQTVEAQLKGSDLILMFYVIYFETCQIVPKGSNTVARYVSGRA